MNFLASIKNPNSTWSSKKRCDTVSVSGLLAKFVNELIKLLRALEHTDFENNQ